MPNLKTSMLRSAIQASIRVQSTHWWCPSSRPIGIRVLLKWGQGLEWEMWRREYVGKRVVEDNGEA
jgi:hypothetical protein